MQTKVSTHTVCITRPQYMDPIYPNMLGMYDPIESKLYSYTSKAGITEGEYIKTPTTLEINQVISEGEVYVKLTEGCNYACPGCATASDVIKPQHARHIETETLQFLLTQIYKSAAEKGMHKIKIKWAGGEPLLRKPFQTIINAQKLVTELSKKHSITTSQTILTNGVFITEQIIAALKKYNIRASVSLWGVKNIHDFSRKPRNQQESFSTVVKNIQSLINNNINYSINTVITGFNAKYLPDFIDFIWNSQSEEYIGRYTDIKNPTNVYFALHRPQTYISEQVLNSTYQQILEGMISGFAKIYELIKMGENIPSLMRFDYLNLANITLTTCGTGYNYLAIGPDGITNCHENLYNMQNNIDILAQNNVFDLAARIFENKEDMLVGLEKSNNMLLALHGGTGCPRQKYLLKTTTCTDVIYEEIARNLLALEIVRHKV